MSKITSVRITNALGSTTTAALGALAENIDFGNGTNLEDRFVPFTGASSTAAGIGGLVPAPASGETSKFLKSDGTWGDPAGNVTSVNGETGAVTLDASDVGAVAAADVGVAGGVAELDSNGKVPAAQLPSYVDDVIEAYYNTTDGKFYEESTYTTEITPETGKIYIDLSTNKTYRWGGSAYAEISESLALGETSSTAYRGDYGKAAHDHAIDASRHTTAETSGLYKIATTAEGHIANVTAVQKSDITNLGIPGSDTTYTANTTSIGSASAWNAGSAASFDINNGVLEITTGSAPSLTVTSTTVATGITADS